MGMAASAGQVSTVSHQTRVTSTVGAEPRKASIDCGGVVLSVALAGGSALSIPVIAGFSSVGLSVASTAFVATSLRCGMSVGRLLNAGLSPDANRILENSDWYSVASTMIDAIDVAEPAHSGLELVGKYKALGRASSKPITELLRNASRADRRISEEIAKLTGEAPSRRRFLRVVRQGKLPRLYGVKQGRAEIGKGLLDAALDANTLTTGALPGQPGEKPGVLYEFMVHVIQEN